MIPLLSSLGGEQELGLISPGLVKGVGIDPTRAWEMSNFSSNGGLHPLSAFDGLVTAGD